MGYQEFLIVSATLYSQVCTTRTDSTPTSEQVYVNTLKIKRKLQGYISKII